MRGSRGCSFRYTSHLSCFYVLAVPQTQNSRAAGLSGLQSLENCESRNSLEVSQSCGLKKRPLVQQTSSGPAATCAADLFGPSSHLENVNECTGRAHCVRWVAQLFQKPSLSCHRWVMTGPGRLDFQKTSLVPHTGRASTSGCQKPSLSCHLDRPGRLVIVQTARTVNWQLYRFPRLLCLVSTPLFFFATGIWRE